MNQRHRRRRHLQTLWQRRSRNDRDRVLEDARQREAERQASLARALGSATTLLPIIPERRTPLLTPGQAYCSKRAAL